MALSDKIREFELRINNIKNSKVLTSRFKKFSKFSENAIVSNDNFELPLVIGGRLITSDYYNEAGHGQVLLSPEELKKNFGMWRGIKIFKGHDTFLKRIRGEMVSVDNVVGKISDVEWNEEDNAIDFTASIFDRDIAYKILVELIDSVSVGFLRDIEITEMGNKVMKGIVPKELSLVFDPRDKRANIKPIKAKYPKS